MHIITGITLVSFFLLVLRGAYRGFSGELAHLVGLCACIGTIWMGFEPAQRAFAYIPQIDPQAISFYATLAVFIVGAIVFFIIAKIVGCISALIIPQPFNAIFGALIGGAKAILFISIIVGSLMLIRDKIKDINHYGLDVPSLKVLVECWDTVIFPGLNLDQPANPPTETEEKNGGR